jgi:predicted AAA+ superfamily ATPase
MESILNEIKKYNCWDGKAFETGYERKDYLEKIAKFINNKLVKVIIGQRRVGKSYVMRQIINYLIREMHIDPTHTFYLNKEYLVFDNIRTSKDLEKLFRKYLEHFNISGKVYIFLDEVQNIENWESFVNSYSQEYTGEYEIFITGSNSKLLSGEFASLLSGRFVEFRIYSFSLFEYSEYKNIEINKKTFLDYLKSGGMPEMFSLHEEEMQRHYIENLKNTVILRDIVERNKVRDITLLEDIFKYIAANTGNLSSVTGLIKYFKNIRRKTNFETLSTYINYLRDTFIIYEAERYNLKGKQVLSGERKYYLGDLAFRNFLFGFSPADIGNNLENYIFMQLLRMGFEVYVGILDSYEVDFVALKGNKTIYIQVSYLLSGTRTIEREFGNLLKIKDNYEKIVISLDDMKFDNFKGILHMHPWELR